VRLSFGEPLVDALNLYLRQVSGLLGRQHLARKLAHGTVRGRRPPDDALLLENGDLNSSSLYRGHGVVVKSAISLSAAFFERRKLPDGPRSNLEENGK
jgi:hypothetical protein